MEFVIVTGMSGAGKSLALKFFEDMEYFCVDNLPPGLIARFFEVCQKADDIKKAVIGIDIRGGKLFDDLFEELDKIDNENYEYKILFLEAADDILLKRYKESRRVHPLAKNDRLTVGIEKERKLLFDLKKRANYIIDTSYLLTREFKEKLNEIFFQKTPFENLMITLVSFGFKNGMTIEADLVFDVRFIENPFYVPDLKHLTGEDKQIIDFVMGETAKTFLEKLNSLLDFLLPQYVDEGKSRLVIGIGCTGGKHRSVVISNEIRDNLVKKGWSAAVRHRDIRKAVE
ncbi:MAG: RNase adapter RapZ [Defluviitaleaceae bacterium]|nr:RNase adapter RapZ [Defluviitaleaceae bacterium]